MTEKKTGSAQVKESPLANVQLHLVDSLEEALSLKRWLGERRETPLGVDTESEGLDPFRHDLRLVQVGDMRQGWALPWPLWGGLAQEVLSTYEGEFVAHNASFDSRMLLKRGNIAVPWHRLHDTMTLATLDDPTRLRGLKPLSSMLIDKNATSGERALSEGMRNNGWGWDTVPYDFPAYWAYGALDPVLTCHLFNHLFPRVNGDCPEVYSLERGVTRVCSNMMLKGIRVDRQYIQDNIVRLKDVSRQSREWLDSVHGIKNPLSSRQISAALEKCGYEVTETTRTGLPKTDKETLTSIRDGQAVPEAAATVARYILGVRHIDKVIGSYLENFLITADSNDVIHCSIMPLAARTGRMAIRDPALQTLHRDDKVVRGCFIPREGHVFISCDADQIEMRMAAHFSNDEGLIKAFHEADQPDGLDFFSSVASQLFHEEIRKGDNRRTLTKNCSYGYLYGAGLEKMAITAGVPVEQMQPIREAFLTRFPGLAVLSKRTESEARSALAKTGHAYIRTPIGRRLPVDQEKLYSGLNYSIQGHAAEIFKKGIIDLDAAGFGDNLLLPVHDEVVLEVPAEDAEDAIRLIEQTLTDRDNYKVPITWEANIMTERWAKT